VAYLLDNTTPIHLGGQSKHMPLHLIGKNLFLRLVAMFKKLLDNIVAKHICHQLQAVGLNFTEHLLLLVAIRCLQLLLNEPRTMLITTELNNVIVNVL
jgi:hypothetical protein